jgi:hypothetical protein
MTHSKLGWLFVATILSGAAAIGVAACSDDSDDTTPINKATPDSSTGTDAGKKPDGATTVDGATGDDDDDAAAAGDSATDGGAGEGGRGDANCGTTPFVRARDAGGPACFRGPDAGSTRCSPGEVCCEPTGAFRTCNANAGACGFDAGSGGRIYECTSTIDCPRQDQVCCGQGSVAPRPNCSYSQVGSGFKGAVCKTSCGAGEFQVCVASGECGDAGTCEAINAFGTFIGLCK